MSGGGWLPTAAATTQGTLTGQETWTAAESPIRITGNLRVAPGATLSIGPGVEVIFAPNPNRRAEPDDGGGLRVTVDGTLRAVGTPEAPIRFRGASEDYDSPGRWNFGMPYDTLKGWNQWEGLIFTDRATEADEEGTTGCVLRYCVFEAAYQPLDIGDCHVLVEYCFFHRLGAGGDRGPGVTMKEGQLRCCFLEWSGESALRLEGPAMVDNCVVVRGFAHGLKARAGSVWNCTFRHLAGAALVATDGEYEVLNSSLEKCSAGLWIDRADFVPPYIANCQFVDLGQPLPFGAVYVTTQAGTPPPRHVLLFGEGTENRLLSTPQINDTVGGLEIVASHVWWGDPRPDTRDLRRFRGQGTAFNLDPPLEEDPFKGDWTFFGTVRDAVGAPVSDALVWIRDGNCPATYTNSEGQYTIQGIQPGIEYEVQAYRPGLGQVVTRPNPPWAIGGDAATGFIWDERPIQVDLHFPRRQTGPG